jgi:hypothetical protein
MTVPEELVATQRYPHPRLPKLEVALPYLDIAWYGACTHLSSRSESGNEGTQMAGGCHPRVLGHGQLASRKIVTSLWHTRASVAFQILISREGLRTQITGEGPD